ncbi:phage GP46 family protein [Ferrovibrio sp.]|uniref:phage GP46 family protein n=1 Tax=Ferrovibrio sp. TaxID=1917215 RepID=UPI0035B1E654
MSELFFAFNATKRIFDLAPPPELADDLDGASLYSAVITSLFTDARAPIETRLPNEPRLEAIADPGLPPPLERDRRGWWAERQIGSLLWTLHRETQIERVRRSAEDYAKQALQWLVDDRVAKALAVSASYPADHVLTLDITIHRPGRPDMRFRFERLWAGTEAAASQLETAYAV